MGSIRPVTILGLYGIDKNIFRVELVDDEKASISIRDGVDVRVWDELAPKIREALVMMWLGDGEK